MNQTLLQELKTKLEQEHEKLVAELKEISIRSRADRDNWDARFPKFEPEESASSTSLEEEADEVEEYEVNLEAGHSLESRLLEVNRALERMKLGGYGICAKCHQEIPENRLRANPAAKFHIGHET